MNNENCTHCASGLGCHYHSMEWANRRIAELTAQRDEARELVRGCNERFSDTFENAVKGWSLFRGCIKDAVKRWNGEK